MSKQDSLRTQNCILKVNIDCNGCARKVKKRLQKIQGVNSVSVDAEQGKVVVVGDKVDPAKLIKKLKSSGMHAELCGAQQKGVNFSNQFQNFQISNSTKGEKDNKSKKGVHDFKVLQKDHKSVKFNLQEEEFDASDDGHDDLEDYSDDDIEEEEGYGHGHAKPKMGNGAGPRGPAGMMNGLNHKGNNGNGKNGHVIDPTMVIKGKSGNKNHNHAKKGNKEEKQNNGNQSDNENDEKVKYMVGIERDGIKKKNAKSNGGGLVSRFLRLGKKSKKGERATADDTYKNNYNEIKKEKEGDGKLNGGGKSNSKNDLDFHGKNGKGSNGNMGQMGPMGMNNPMDIRAVQRHPEMNGDRYHHPQGIQMQMQPPSYNQQQQQYMAMMMNQQRQQHQQQQPYMNNMYPQAMMYGMQHPSMNYMPPPPMPVHPMNDPFTHTFSDENVESCNIM